MQDRADDSRNPGYAARTSRMSGREEVAGVTDWARTGGGDLSEGIRSDPTGEGCLEGRL